MTRDGVPHNAVVLAQDLARSLIAEPLGHAGVIDHVAEEDGDGAVGGKVAPDVLLECGQFRRVRHGVRRLELSARRGPGELLARAVRAALDVDPAHDGETLHHDPGRAGENGHVTQPEVTAAHEGEAAQLNVEPLGHDDVDPAPEGEGGDFDLGTFDLGLAEIHVATAHDRHGVRLPADAPATLGAVAAHDRHMPAPLLLGRAGTGLGQALVGRARLGQVGHDGHQVAPGSGLEG